MRRTFGLRQHHSAVPELRGAAGRPSFSSVPPASASADTLALQLRSRSGDYIDVPVVPGAVLVNIADLMQRWTSDRFVSAVSAVTPVRWRRSSVRQAPRPWSKAWL